MSHFFSPWRWWGGGGGRGRGWLLSTCLFGFKLTCAYMYIIIMCRDAGNSKELSTSLQQNKVGYMFVINARKEKKQTPATMVWYKCSPHPFRYLAFGKSAPV